MKLKKKKTNIVLMSMVILAIGLIPTLFPSKTLTSTAYADVLQNNWEDKTSIVVKDVTIYAGEQWHYLDNIVSLTDKDGNSASPITSDNDHQGVVVGYNFDISKPIPVGTYNITYMFRGKTVISHLIVKEDETTIAAKASLLYVGDRWSPANNFTSATDRDGKPVDFSKVNVTGTVDTSKTGNYPITYSYGGQSTTIYVTVKIDQTKIETKNITLHVGDTWSPYDNITGFVDKDGMHHNWTTSDGIAVLQNGVNRGRAFGVGIITPSGSKLVNGKVTGLGDFSVYYNYKYTSDYSAGSETARATITVLP